MFQRFFVLKEGLNIEENKKKKQKKKVASGQEQEPSNRPIQGLDHWASFSCSVLIETPVP